MLHGNNGNDTLIGGSGTNDVLYGGNGNDHLFGANIHMAVLNDALDYLIGNAGDHSLVAGGRVDAVQYHEDAGAVNVDLETDIENDGYRGTDMIVGVEQVAGIPFDDTLSGDGAANALFGDDGDNDIASRGGNDALYGQAGRNALHGDPGNDFLSGFAILPYSATTAATAFTAAAGTIGSSAMAAVTC